MRRQEARMYLAEVRVEGESKERGSKEETRREVRSGRERKGRSGTNYGGAGIWLDS